jgi:hypothetical protein
MKPEICIICSEEIKYPENIVKDVCKDCKL